MSSFDYTELDRFDFFDEVESLDEWDEEVQKDALDLPDDLLNEKIYRSSKKEQSKDTSQWMFSEDDEVDTVSLDDLIYENDY